VTFTEQDVEDLADGLRDAAGTDDSLEHTPAEAWQAVTRYAFERAEIDITDEQFERAWRVAWRRASMGGSYTLDARAILRAAHDSAPSPEESR